MTNMKGDSVNPVAETSTEKTEKRVNPSVDKGEALETMMEIEPEEAERQRNRLFAQAYNGTILDKMSLILFNHDFGRLYKKTIITNEQRSALLEQIKSKKEYLRLGAYYSGIFNGLVTYGRIAKAERDLYQKEAARLTTLITLFEEYEEDARDLSDMVKRGIIKFEEGMDVLTFEFGTKYKAERNVRGLRTQRKRGSGAATIVIHKDGSSELDVDGEGRLYDMMVKQAEITKKALSVLKSFIETVEEYMLSLDGGIYYNTLLPLELERLMEYPDYIPEQNDCSKERFFKLFKRYRQERGETITTEEEKYYLYPDYNEIECTEEEVKAAQKALNDFFAIWIPKNTN